jgi:hypothetical protein
MKRICACIVVLITIFFFVTPSLSPLVAQSAAQTIDCDGPAKPGDPPCIIGPDIADKPIVNSDSISPCTTDEETGQVTCARSVTHSWGSEEYTPGGGYQTPDFTWIGDWLKNTDIKLNPSVVEENTVANTNPQYESHVTRRCILDSDNVIRQNVVSSDAITIGPISWIPPISQYSDTMSQRYSLRQKNPDEEGNYNYEEKTETLDPSLARPCGYDTTSAPVETAPSQTSGRIAFGPFQFVRAIINAVSGLVDTSTRILTPSKRLAKAEKMTCLSTDCSVGDLGDSPLSDEQKEYYENTPGFIATTKVSGLQIDPTEINGEIINPFTGAVSANETRTYMTNKLQNSYQYLCATLFPPDQLPEQCKGQFSLAGSCTTKTLPDLDTSGGSCTLCNTDDLNSYVKRYGYPKLPDLLIQILNKAGESFNVPASFLLSIMYSEGGLEKWQWTDDNTEEWSVCGGEVPKCDALASPTGARGPFAFISSRSGSGYDWGATSNYADASKIVDPSRTQFSPCNLLDAAFAAAEKLHIESGGTGKYPYATCWNHPIYQTTAGVSTSCSWDEARIATGVRQYTGYCTEPGKNSGTDGRTYPPQTAGENHYDRAVTFYNKYTCR